jgi:xanthine dehydrogenase accessory factor
MQAALCLLQSGDPQFIEVDLSGHPYGARQDGICGGSMQVWVQRWSAHHRSLLHHLLQALQSNQPWVWVTPFDRGRQPFLRPASPEETAIHVSETELIEPLIPNPQLLIVGAGHIAQPLAQMAHLAGFRVMVVEDRPEWARAERFPHAQVRVGSVASVMAELSSGDLLYAALVTQGYEQDLGALRCLLTVPSRYIGLIGSQRRVQWVRHLLSQEGYFPQALQNFYGPIGLDLGGFTPAEIAVSICAEVILVRRGGTGRSRSDQALLGGRESWLELFPCSIIEGTRVHSYFLGILDPCRSLTTTREVA